MFDFNILDVSGDNIFNGLDLLIWFFNFCFWWHLIKTVIFSKSQN